MKAINNHVLWGIPNSLTKYAPERLRCDGTAKLPHECRGDGCLICKDVHDGERELFKAGHGKALDQCIYKSISLLRGPAGSLLSGFLGLEWGHLADKFEDLDAKYMFDEPMIFYTYRAQKDSCCWQRIREEIVKNKKKASSTSTIAP